ncbi:hypothetical protein AJ80_07601 [Polytolypa hystricis UAMH7299]|uniref:Rhodopsin domain-containing protein n=1 Tax=Polytolypa hystricis (strain UAMH7299) TaxID=1447883 RepID=A0A2B7XM79_POLH7|nr:hypothetical protein AJ80_07601 [Polytolypa hystricis UAMH7299]
MESASMIFARLYSDTPPTPQMRVQTNPTLLVSWWCTGCALVIIILRIGGRCSRTRKLFPEDWIMILSVIPLVARMVLVNFVLSWGTNNVISENFTDDEIRRRENGAKLVLTARIFYALFIWTAKFTVSEFLKRLTSQIWRRAFQNVLQFIRYFLAVTFVMVVIATLTECQPFYRHWQVYPDPGPKCRLGYAHLITMGAFDIVTDLLLIAFPIPLILISTMTTKRRVSLTCLFALSSILIAITCYRIPSVIKSNGNQQHRSLIASIEILAATAVSNAIVIGSFIRDRGLKKRKYNGGGSTNGLDGRVPSRTTLTYHQWGSDADLACDVGMRLEPELHLTTCRDSCLARSSTAGQGVQSRCTPQNENNSAEHYPSPVPDTQSLFSPRATGCIISGARSLASSGGPLNTPNRSSSSPAALNNMSARPGTGRYYHSGVDDDEFRDFVELLDGLLWPSSSTDIRLPRYSSSRLSTPVSPTPTPYPLRISHSRSGSSNIGEWEESIPSISIPHPAMANGRSRRETVDSIGDYSTFMIREPRGLLGSDSDGSRSLC